MDLFQLPPRPDPETGHPRPPQAPLEPDWSPTKGEKKAGIPAPPKGEGRVLEWFHTITLSSVMAGVFMLVIGVVFLTIRDMGFSWMRVWWLWLILLPWPFIMFFASRDRMSAGADWYKYGRRYVKTYELTSVKVKGTSGGAAWDLDLEDSGGRKVTTQLGVIQQNPKLWDLVYNGILHSVHHGGAETNRRARDRLQLR